jgi:hypothetical protein
VPTATPTVPPAPTAAVRRPEIIRIFPEVPSKVVHARRADARQGGELVSEVLCQMLDASIVELTGLPDAAHAWRAVFSPEERIAIKVNGHKRGAVHVPLAAAVTECLQAAGIPAEQILVWDRSTSELEGEGYPANVDGPGVRWHGTDGSYRKGWTLLDRDIRLSELLLGYNALINLSILKVAGGPGISFALKNHYGTFDRPRNYHGTKFERGIAELNALKPIRERARLVIGDVLTHEDRRDTAGYRMMGTGDALLMSFDPVAHDAVGLELARQLLDDEGTSTESTTAQAMAWLEHAAGLGLGTNDVDQIDWVNVPG